MKLVICVLAIVMVGCTVQDKQKRFLDSEQLEILATMPKEEAYYVKDCYVNNNYRTFSMCLQMKEEIYNKQRVIQQNGGMDIGSAVVGYAAGALIHNGKK